MTTVNDVAAHAAQIAEDRMASEDSEAKAKELEAEARRLANLPMAQRAIERRAVAKRFDVLVGGAKRFTKASTTPTETSNRLATAFRSIARWAKSRLARRRASASSSLAFASEPSLAILSSAIWAALVAASLTVVISVIPVVDGYRR